MKKVIGTMQEKKSDDDRSSDNRDLTRELKKTELKEVPNTPVVAQDRKPDAGSFLVQVAKRAAMEAIGEEVAMFKKLIEETEDVSQKLTLIERLAALKLRAVGIVIGGMSLNRR